MEHAQKIPNQRSHRLRTFLSMTQRKRSQLLLEYIPAESSQLMLAFLVLRSIGMTIQAVMGADKEGNVSKQMIKVGNGSQYRVSGQSDCCCEESRYACHIHDDTKL